MVADRIQIADFVKIFTERCILMEEVELRCTVGSIKNGRLDKTTVPNLSTFSRNEDNNCITVRPTVFIMFKYV